MDTKTLLTESKARFNHNSAKAYLNEKYSSKLLVAEQGGLWRADAQTIGLLHSCDTDSIILLDTFNNIVEVDRTSLLDKLQTIYTTVMTQWHTEWKELESKR
jgi:hypothetical protein